MAKKTRVNKSKQQIVADLKSNQDFQKKMVFVREKFWPALCKASKSVDDAQILLSGFNNVIMQEFLGKMKEVNMKDMKLSLKLDTHNDMFLESQELLALFDDMDVFTAKDYIEGMRNEISLFRQEEDKNRPLSELKTKWVDEYVAEKV